MSLVRRRRHVFVVVMALSLAPSLGAAEPISIDGFRDGMRHWKNGQGVDGYASYQPEQFREIADNLLLYQRAGGGWPPNFDPLRVLTEDEKRELAAQREREDTS